MKYLIMEDFSGQPIPFIFPRRVDHGDMREQLPYGKVLSAGFLELAHEDEENTKKTEGLRCHGGNNELEAHSRPEDVHIIKEALRAR